MRPRLDHLCFRLAALALGGISVLPLLYSRAAPDLGPVISLSFPGESCPIKAVIALGRTEITFSLLDWQCPRSFMESVFPKMLP
jgi:hypothetical protein